MSIWRFNLQQMHEIIEQHKDLIHHLCVQNNVHTLHFFGSITEPERFHKESDIDILVSFDLNELSPEEYTDSYFSLQFGLEDLLGRTVDITTERSINNPFFQEELDRTKVLFYDASLKEVDACSV